MQYATDQVRDFLGNGPVIHLGRFSSWRRAYSRLMSAASKPELVFHRHNIENVGSRIRKSTATVFSRSLVETCVTDLRAEGVTARLQLPDSTIEAMTGFARQASFRQTDDSAPPSQVGGTAMPGTMSGLRRICSDITSSDAIMSILSDHVLCQIAARYLGYEPAVVEAYLERLSAPKPGDRTDCYPPFGYHYDVPGFNFIGIFFYLTEVNAATGGEHVMIRGSHNDKPFRFMLKSARSAGRQVFSYYSADAELYIHGAKGAGFAEDLYAFHRVTPPRGTERLTLQIRYY